jgi:hypothetical protein
VTGLAILQHFFERVDKSKHGAGIQSLAVDAGSPEKSIIGSEDQGVSVKQIKIWPCHIVSSEW